MMSSMAETEREDGSNTDKWQSLAGSATGDGLTTTTGLGHEGKSKPFGHWIRTGGGGTGFGQPLFPVEEYVPFGHS